MTYLHFFVDNKSDYDRVMLDAMDPTLKYYQFGEKRPLPKGTGLTMVWNRPTRLAKGFLLSEGVTTSTANTLSTAKVSAIIRQFGGYTSVSDMVDLTSITDVMTMAAERLGAQAGETIERVIINELAIGNAGAGIHLVKNSASIGDYFESVSGVSVCSNGTAPGSVLGATGCYANVISVSNIRTCIYRLKKLNVHPYEGNDYISITNTETAEDLVGDSTWINFHQIGGSMKRFVEKKLTKLQEHLFLLKIICSEGLNATFNDYEGKRNNICFNWNGFGRCEFAHN